METSRKCPLIFDAAGAWLANIAERNCAGNVVDSATADQLMPSIAPTVPAVSEADGC